MWRRGICFSTAVFACVAALAQTLDRNLSFDVASVKRAPLGDGLGMTHVRGGWGSADPGLVTYSNITLMNLLGRAFPESYRTAGPDWLDSERYDVIVKVPPGTTGDQFQVMLQNLLAERFRLKVHHESREFPAYDLTVAKGGPKLKDTGRIGPGSQTTVTLDRSGFPQLDKPGMFTTNTFDSSGAQVARLTAKAQPVSKLVVILRNALKAPVQDKTGLTGLYDFKLEYAPKGPIATLPPGNAAAPEIGGPGITYAIRSLGLALERTKTTLDVLVVDHAEKSPAAN